MSPTLLVVNDSPLLSRFIRNVFLQCYPSGNTVSCRRAHEGARIAAHQKVDLIIFDNHLGDLRAAGFARLLLENPLSRSVPVVVTHRASEEPEVRAYPLPNIVRLLPKPFPPEELVETIRSLIERAPAPAAQTATMPRRSREILKIHPGNVETSLAPEIPAPRQPPAPPPPPAQLPPPKSPLAPPGDKPRARIEPQSAPRQTSDILFRGNTESFPLPSALAAIEDDHLTGVLRLFASGLPTEVFFTSGRILLATTRDTARYIAEIPDAAALMALPGIGMANEIQRSTGCPIFLTLSREGAMGWEEAVDEARLQSTRITARAWEGDRTSYEFERLPVMPDYLKGVEPLPDSTYQWALNVLRCFESENRRTRRRFEAAGVPAFSPEGYELIQKLRLTKSEAAFASAVDNSSTVEKIADAIGVPPRAALIELRKFVMLQIMDYWPPAVLARA